VEKGRKYGGSGQVVYALIDNCIIIILTIITAFLTEEPVLLLSAAGVLLVTITAESMGVHVTWLKWILCACFALAAGVWPGFLVFGVLWPKAHGEARTDREIHGETRAVRGISSEGEASGHGILYWIPIPAAVFLYFGWTIFLKRDELSGQLFAVTLLPALAVGAGVALIFLLKQVVCFAEHKHRAEQEQLRQSTVSEMHEKKLNRQLAQQSYLADKNARLTERENISRNIHNSVGHSITAAIMTLDAADMLYDKKPEEARKRMNDANERIRGSLESIRRAVRTLDQDSQDVPLTDLIAGMDSIIDEFVMDTERVCNRLYDDFPAGMQLPHEHLEFLTGVLQELLTNGVKHGQADTFLVSLTGDSAHIRLTVKDNGHSDYGAENEKQRLAQGFGLKKIISYTERCGGHAEFTNEDGFRSVVELPVTT